MSEIKSVIPNIAEDVFGKEGKYIAEAALHVVDITQNAKKLKEEKLKALSNKQYDMSYQYNEVILENFTTREFQYYGSERKISIQKIKAEIESRKYFRRNIILTGQAGVGKTTVLKWLFLHSNIPKSKYIFIYAKMFDDCESLNEVLKKMENIIPNDKRCVVFFDGLDELKCIDGNEHEFNRFFDFFDRRSNHEDKKPDCKFIISTRPEHFGFNNKIINNNSDFSIDNYAVFTLLPLTKKQIFKICKSIKRMNQFDKKYNLKNFADKWPSDHKGEAEYIKHLNSYLNSVDADFSLLNIPLFCRYAYQIICDWKLQEHINTNQMNMTQSEKIQNVLESYIKWEFHDRYRNQTKGEKGKQLLDNYTNQVFDFLTELASLMKDKESISKQCWEELKNAKKIDINMAFCALQEDDTGNIRFIHNTFREFFLARYYVSNQHTDEETKHLSDLLRKNSQFSILYVEQMTKSSNELVRKICHYLLDKNDMDIGKLSEYANGKRKLIYKPSITFTIEEYLAVFPEGVFLYAGINFNRYRLDKLKSDGILEVTDINYLEGCNQRVISKKTLIKGMQCKLLFSYRHFLLFYIYKSSDLKFIDGYLHSKELSRKQRDILLSQQGISYETIINNKDIQLVSKQFYNDESKKYEKERFKKLSSRMIEFLGKDKNYWCLMDEYSIHIYMMISENEETMRNLFLKGKQKYPNEYINAFGNYRAKTQNTETIMKEGYNYTTDSLPFVFNAEQATSIISGSFFEHYYYIHYKNIKLLKYRMTVSSIFQYDNAGSNLDIYNIFESYAAIEEILENSENEKLQLYYSDEKLLTLYFLGKSEEMVGLAQDTLSLCEDYQHIHGLKFREFLLRDDTGFIGDDLKKVYEYSEKYIWI